MKTVRQLSKKYSDFVDIHGAKNELVSDILLWKPRIGKRSLDDSIIHI